jgi:hypothetical protein
MLPRKLSLALTLGFLLAALTIAGRPIPEQVEASVPHNSGGSSSILIPYQGHLTRPQGPLADGERFSFQFAIYENAVGGEPLWGETQGGIALQNGSFQVNLGSQEPLPSALSPAGDYWLEVAVKAASDAGYTLLTPRQRLVAASSTGLDAPQVATNGAACPHDHFGEQWSGTSQFYGLNVVNNENTGIRGQGEGTGVLGVSSSGYGVYASSNDGYGLLANSSTGIAILAAGNGRIYSNADSVLVLSPFSLVSRGSSNVTLTPQDNGAMEIHSTAGTETKYLVVPVSNLGTLFGSSLYVKSLEVCYKVGGVIPPAHIDVTGVYKNNNGESYLTYLESSTEHNNINRECYTINAATPRKAIDNSTWVQFNVETSIGTEWYLHIFTVKLTLTESQN